RDQKPFDETSVVSDLGFDGEESSVCKAPTDKELSVELFQLMNPNSSGSSGNNNNRSSYKVAPAPASVSIYETLEKLQVWTFVAGEEEHSDTSRIFVKQRVVPALLCFIRTILANERGDDACLDKAARIIYHCTSFHDRCTRKLEKYSKDMNMQLVKHNGIETIVKSMQRFHLDESFTGRSTFNTLWTILMNVATCDKTVALLKFPKAMFELQEELLLDAIACFMAKAEAQVQVFWMENMLVALHRLLKFDDKFNLRTRQVMAHNKILNRLLDVLMHGKKRLGTKDPCATALAMSLFQTCLFGGGIDDDNDDTSVVEKEYKPRRHDLLRESIDFDRLTRFTFQAMERFRSSDVIQGLGCVILDEMNPVYTHLVCHDDDLVFKSPCQPEIGGDNITASNVVAAMAGSFLHCRPTKLY
ncbi:MAG: hypothetical protein SGILL_005397, partial [Bacillariaceae sp.]